MEGMGIGGGDKGAYVRFYKYMYKGRNLDFVEIIHPGEKNSEWRGQVKPEEHPVRFPLQWQAYQNGEESKLTGHPLEQWATIDIGMVRELNHNHIFTVEQLASVSDVNLAKLGMGVQDLGIKARAFVESMERTGVSEEYAAKFESIKKENANIIEQNKRLMDMVKSLEEQVAALAPKTKK